MTEITAEAAFSVRDEGSLMTEKTIRTYCSMLSMTTDQSLQCLLKETAERDMHCENTQIQLEIGLRLKAS